VGLIGDAELVMPRSIGFERLDLKERFASLSGTLVEVFVGYDEVASLKDSKIQRFKIQRFKRLRGAQRVCFVESFAFGSKAFASQSRGLIGLLVVGGWDGIGCDSWKLLLLILWQLEATTTWIWQLVLPLPGKIVLRLDIWCALLFFDGKIVYFCC